MMYAWWTKLMHMAMWQMLLTGILNGYLIRIGYDLYKEINVERNRKSLIKGLALMLVDAVVSIYIIHQAAVNECPLFVVYRIYYEYMLIGIGLYAFWHFIPADSAKSR